MLPLASCFMSSSNGIIACMPFPLMISMTWNICLFLKCCILPLHLIWIAWSIVLLRNIHLPFTWYLMSLLQTWCICLSCLFNDLLCCEWDGFVIWFVMANLIYFNDVLVPLFSLRLICLVLCMYLVYEIIPEIVCGLLLLYICSISLIWRKESGHILRARAKSQVPELGKQQHYLMMDVYWSLVDLPWQMG